jgi:hypothetical protein
MNFIVVIDYSCYPESQEIINTKKNSGVMIQGIYIVICFKYNVSKSIST